MMRAGSYREALERALVSEGSRTCGLHTPDLLSILCLAFDSRRWGHGIINPFTTSPGEVLPLGFFRNYDGLSVCGEVPLSLSEVEGEALAQEVEFLQQHVVITCFAEGILSPAAEFGWIAELRGRVAPGQILFHRPAGCGVFYMRTDGAATTQKVLMLMPHRFPRSTAIYEPLGQGFQSPSAARCSYPNMDYA
jgi:hypothetical protein